VWLAELSVLRNAELPARTVAASLGLPDEATGDPVMRSPRLVTRVPGVSRHSPYS